MIAEANGTYSANVIDSNGCMWSTDVITVVLNVGVQEAGQEGLLSYPNPANTVINMTGLNGSILRAVAVDVLGRGVDLPVIGAAIVDVQDLAAGAWVVRVETGSGIHISRFVKE